MAASPSEVAGIVYLIQHAGIVGINGISPPPLPAIAVTPYVTVHEVMGIGLESLSGPSGLKRTLMQVNVWGLDYEVAWNLREGLRTLILGTTGDVGNGRVIDATNHSAGYGAGDAELFDTVRLYHQLISRIAVWWSA